MQTEQEVATLASPSPTKAVGPSSPGAQSANVVSPGTPTARCTPQGEAVGACAASPPVALGKSPGTPASALTPFAPPAALVPLAPLVLAGAPAPQTPANASAPLAVAAPLDDLATGLQQSEAQPSGCGEFQCSRCMEMCPISQLLGNRKDNPGGKAVELICNSNYKALARRWKKDRRGKHIPRLKLGQVGTPPCPMCCFHVRLGCPPPSLIGIIV